LKGILFRIVLLFAFVSACAAQIQSSPVAIITSPSLHHVPSIQHMQQVLRYAAVELRVSDRPMPRLVILFADRHTADVLQMSPGAAVLVDASDDPGRNVYQATIVDDTGDGAMSTAAIEVLNHYFRLGLTQPRIMAAVAKVRDNLSQVVRVEELATKDGM
jgi:hypothetical protein